MAEAAVNSCRFSLSTGIGSLRFSLFDGSRPQVQFGHSLMAVQPNCPRKNQSGSWVSPQAAVKRRRRGLDIDSRQRPWSSPDLAGGEPEAEAPEPQGMPHAGWPRQSLALPVRVDQHGPGPDCQTVCARPGVPHWVRGRSLLNRPPLIRWGHGGDGEGYGNYRAAVRSLNSRPPAREGRSGVKDGSKSAKGVYLSRVNGRNRRGSLARDRRGRVAADPVPVSGTTPFAVAALTINSWCWPIVPRSVLMPH